MFTVLQNILTMIVEGLNSQNCLLGTTVIILPKATSIFFLFFPFLAAQGFELRDSHFPKQALYHRSYTSSQKQLPDVKGGSAAVIKTVKILRQVTA
jgi:hypothetical protein